MTIFDAPLFCEPLIWTISCFVFLLAMLDCVCATWDAAAKRGKLMCSGWRYQCDCAVCNCRWIKTTFEILSQTILELEKKKKRRKKEAIFSLLLNDLRTILPRKVMTQKGRVKIITLFFIGRLKAKVFCFPCAANHFECSAKWDDTLSACQYGVGSPPQASPERCTQY